jgi:hypothetical protein
MSWLVVHCGMCQPALKNKGRLKGACSQGLEQQVCHGLPVLKDAWQWVYTYMTEGHCQAQHVNQSLLS